MTGLWVSSFMISGVVMLGGIREGMGYETFCCGRSKVETRPLVFILFL